MIASFILEREGTAEAVPKSATQHWFCVAQRFGAAIRAPFPGALAPEGGPFRFAKAAALLSIAILSATFLHAQDARTPVTRDEVWQAVTSELRHRGVADQQMVRAEEIELPSAVPAAPGRSLRVSMVCWDAELQRAQFQMECREPRQCVPFLAYAAAGRSTTMGSERVLGSSCRNVPHQPPAKSAPHKNIVRVGDRATVFFRGDALRMTALVTCLERGAKGDLIRVRNQDGQIFRARILAPAQLEALSQ